MDTFKTEIEKAKSHLNIESECSEKIKVAAYCRVSTGNEEQQNSFKNQSLYYTQLIENTENWVLVGIYADDGYSGTSTKKRTEFNRMISDAKSGDIDMIITKSISRFARNTADTIQHTKDLKALGIAVFFENENVNSMDEGGELLMTSLGAIAQEESRSISENIRWAYKKKFEDGKMVLNDKYFLGYDKDENGKLVINEAQAVLVRRIYDEYLNGYSTQKIADGLMADGIPTVRGNEKWWNSNIAQILKNEKYKGDLLLQKTVTVDYLSRTRIRNDGIEDQYLIKNHHEPIISPTQWEAVQFEMERRASLKGNNKGERKGKYSQRYGFSSKIICGECGGVHKRIHWHSGTEQHRVVWRCKNSIGKNSLCDSFKVEDELLKKQAFEVMIQILEAPEKHVDMIKHSIEKVLKSEQLSSKEKAMYHVANDKTIKLLSNNSSLPLEYDDELAKEFFSKILIHRGTDHYFILHTGQVMRVSRNGIEMDAILPDCPNEDIRRFITIQNSLNIPTRHK